MKKLLCLLSFCFGVIISVEAYSTSGDWVWYNLDEGNKLIVRPESAKEGNRKIPNGDCLEMMCQYGCVENEEGVGKCCPEVGSLNNACKSGDVSLDMCCQTDKELVCSSEGKCVCPEGKEWMDEIGKCCINEGCGCDVRKDSNGCCPDQPAGCDGVCGSGKVDVGCGCGVAPTAEWCCPGQVRGCDGVCGSGKVDVGCGCGVVCPPCDGTRCGSNCCNSNQECVNSECLDKLYCKHFGGNPCRSNVMVSEFESQAQKRGKSTKQLVAELCGSNYKGAWVRKKDAKCTNGGKVYYPTSLSKYSSPITGSSSYSSICKDKDKAIGAIYKYPYSCPCDDRDDC